jgi:hypothetical protein
VCCNLRVHLPTWHDFGRASFFRWYSGPKEKNTLFFVSILRWGSA